MPGYDIVVIGASAGGVKALMTLVGALPADLPAAVFIVLHISSQGTSALPTILSRSGLLPVTHAVDGAPIARGHVYVAPPDRHVLIEGEHMRLDHGPRENRQRPAIDPLFRSAAATYGQQVIGVILTGMLDDGTAGLLAVKRHGGIAIVQDPSDSLYPGMPRSVLAHVDVDYCLPLVGIAPMLAQLAREPVESKELQVANSNTLTAQDDMPMSPSTFPCPDCGGVLQELHDGKFIQYLCRVGHRFSPESLLAAQSDGLETALWAAIRALEERAELAHRMARRAQEHQREQIASRFTDQARETERHAALIRQLLSQSNPDPSALAG